MPRPGKFFGQAVTIFHWYFSLAAEAAGAWRGEGSGDSLHPATSITAVTTRQAIDVRTDNGCFSPRLAGFELAGRWPDYTDLRRVAGSSASEPVAGLIVTAVDFHATLVDEQRQQAVDGG